MAHKLPTDLPRKLNLHAPPLAGTAATGYHDLLMLLEEFGRYLDTGSIQEEDLRRWERAVISHLHGREIDLFMHVPDESEFDSSLIPEQRWKNLRSILLERKGISRRSVETNSD